MLLFQQVSIQIISLQVTLNMMVRTVSQRKSDTFMCTIYCTVVFIHFYIPSRQLNVIDSGVIVLVKTTSVKK